MRLRTVFFATALVALFGFLSLFRSFQLFAFVSCLAGGLVGIAIPWMVTRLQVLKAYPIEAVLYSWLFVLAFGVLALEVMTSTASLFSRGVILGVGLTLLSDLVISAKNPQVLKERWFSFFRAKLGEQEQMLFVWGSVLGFGVLFFLGIRS